MRTNRIGRRKFLHWTLTLAGFGASGLLRPLTASGGDAVRTALFQKLHATFDGRRRSVEGVGRAYLNSLASVPSANAMADDLLAAIPALSKACLHAGTEQVQNVLWQRFRRDFAEERTVELQGYVLSVTECRLCGLIALLTIGN